MKEIKCPKCGEMFQIDESGYAEILKSVRNDEFENELKERENYIKSEMRLSIEKLEAERKSLLEKLEYEKKSQIEKIELENFTLKNFKGDAVILKKSGGTVEAINSDIGKAQLTTDVSEKIDVRSI